MTMDMLPAAKQRNAWLQRLTYVLRYRAIPAGLIAFGFLLPFLGVIMLPLALMGLHASYNGAAVATIAVAMMVEVFGTAITWFVTDEFDRSIFWDDESLELIQVGLLWHFYLTRCLFVFAFMVLAASLIYGFCNEIRILLGWF